MNNTDPAAAAAAAWAAAMKATTMDKSIAGATILAAVSVSLAHAAFVLRLCFKPDKALAPFRNNLLLGTAAGMLWVWGMVWDARVSTTPPASPADLPTPKQCVVNGLWATWVLGEGIAVAAFLYRVATTCFMTWARVFGSDIDAPDEAEDAALVSGHADVRPATDVPQPGDRAPPICCGCLRATAPMAHTPSCFAVTHAICSGGGRRFKCQTPKALIFASVPPIIVTAAAAFITFALPREEAFQPDLASGCALADTARGLFTAALVCQAVFVIAVLLAYNSMIRNPALRYPCWFYLLLYAAVVADIAFNAIAWKTVARDAPSFRALRVITVAILLCTFTVAQLIVQVRSSRHADAARVRRPPPARQAQGHAALADVDITLTTDENDDGGDEAVTVPGPPQPQQPPGSTRHVTQQQRDRLAAAARTLGEPDVV